MTLTGRSDPDIGCPVSCRAQPMFHRVLDANPATVRAALQDVRQRFQPEVCEDTLGRLELVLAEVMNNVAEHAPRDVPAPRPGRPPVIHLCIVRHDGGLACALTDDGISLPEGCILPRSLPALIPGDLPEGGFGWFMIQDLTQALCYYREDSRNYLAFSLPFAPPEDG